LSYRRIEIHFSLSIASKLFQKLLFRPPLGRGRLTSKKKNRNEGVEP
jgi:hypothetical protein